MLSRSVMVTWSLASRDRCAFSSACRLETTGQSNSALVELARRSLASDLDARPMVTCSPGPRVRLRRSDGSLSDVRVIGIAV